MLSRLEKRCNGAWKRLLLGSEIDLNASISAISRFRWVAQVSLSRPGLLLGVGL
jgi:hypothetical protein